MYVSYICVCIYIYIYIKDKGNEWRRDALVEMTGWCSPVPWGGVWKLLNNVPL